MNIKEVGDAAGLPAKTIRYYEEIGLIRPSARTANNYRVYSDGDVHVLRFIKRARSLGFSLEETERQLLATGWITPTLAGSLILLAQALVVAGVTTLQGLGLRRGMATPA